MLGALIARMAAKVPDSVSVFAFMLRQQTTAPPAAVVVVATSRRHGRAHMIEAHPGEPPVGLRAWRASAENASCRFHFRT